MSAEPAYPTTADVQKYGQLSEGVQNANLQLAADRLIRGGTYRDLSTICVVPVKEEKLHWRVAQSLEGLIKPMNNAFSKWFVVGMEVGDAYNAAIAQILAHPDLSKWKFMLTVEHDNLPPPDGLLKLQAAMCESPFAAVSGLYWTKGEGGQPMIYGDPLRWPINYIPQVPKDGGLQECRGIGMGFALWDLELFKDKRLGPPWFVTKQEWNPATGAQQATQDLYFCGQATKYGYRFAVDTSVRVGHLDFNTGIVW